MPENQITLSCSWVITKSVEVVSAGDIGPDSASQYDHRDYVLLWVC
jgi:hypothetical protein